MPFGQSRPQLLLSAYCVLLHKLQVVLHHNDVTWTSWRLKSLPTRYRFALSPYKGLLMRKAFPCHDVTIKHEHFDIVAKGLDCHLSGNRKHDDVIKWKHFPRYWPFVRGIHRSPVNSPHKGQWCGALVFSLIWVWINGWVNNREAVDLRRHRAHDEVIVMNIVVNGTRNPHVAISKCPVSGLNTPGLSSFNLHSQQRLGACLF